MLFSKLLLATSLLWAPQTDDGLSAKLGELRARGLKELGAFRMLEELTTRVGPRMSGSIGAENAVIWGEATAGKIGLENIRLIKCKVPHWTRGEESVGIVGGGPLAGCALGGSVGTPKRGIEAPVIEVQSLDEAKALGEKAKGKIVFYNGAFDTSIVDTFGQYGKAVGQRVQGAAIAAKLGAVGVVVRSMSSALDDVPHTGLVRYEEGTPKIPAMALGIQSANVLSARLKRGPLKLHMTLGCQILPDAESASVVAEIRGSEKPEEVLVVGGHLDSWDKGTGAHDDGAGVVQSLEALRLMKVLGWKPKRTIRVVLFMDEEQGGSGAKAYLEWAKKSGEKHLVGMESDRGGFAPRGFTTSLADSHPELLSKWRSSLAEFGIEWFKKGGGGADVGPLAEIGAALFGYVPDSQRYFDLHHSDNDTIDKVNPRELELGALSMAALLWMISEEGLPAK